MPCKHFIIFGSGRGPARVKLPASSLRAAQKMAKRMSKGGAHVSYGTDCGSGLKRKVTCINGSCSQALSGVRSKRKKRSKRKLGRLTRRLKGERS